MLSRTQIATPIFWGSCWLLTKAFFLISFLIHVEDDGKKATYTWLTPAKIEAVDSEQVFINLEVKETVKIFHFPQLEEIGKRFPRCRDSLIRQMKAQVFNSILPNLVTKAELTNIIQPHLTVVS